MLVLDASAAVAMVLDTPEGRALRELVLKGERTGAPRLFCVEVTNALWKYANAGVIDSASAKALTKAALSLIDEFYGEHDLAVEVLAEALRLRHSTNDIFYLVLARRLDATLFTLDKKLRALCEETGVSCVHLIELDEH